MNDKKCFASLIILLLISTTVFATNYYVNAKIGDDTNKGNSKQKPWKTLSKINNHKFMPGDSILLANGQEFRGTISWLNQHGSRLNPIVISNYTVLENNDKPTINAKNFLNGIKLTNCSYIVLKNLNIKANGGKKNRTQKRRMRCGVFILATKDGTSNNIRVQNLEIKDVFYENFNFQRGKNEVKTPNGTQYYGWGIRVINANTNYNVENITIKSCEISNVSHTGIKFTGKIGALKIYDNKVFKTGGPGIQMSKVFNAHVKGNNVNYSGSNDDSRKWGRGSGLWTWACDKVLIEHNAFKNANGPADSAGCHIDFNCSNVIIQYNISENNAGGFCEILGSNYNCAYRYNISINDGYRVKGKNGAFQDGKIYWLSGFVGKKKKRQGPYNTYFYNNTIYVKKDLVAKIAIAKVASGILLMNNIFYIEGDTKAVLGDQYQPQKAEKTTFKNVVFENNLFLNIKNWPKTILIQDQSPSYGNPQFINAGSNAIKDYIPTRIKLIKNKGKEIPHIPGDNYGLFLGLKVKKDILGNAIKGLPDIGAIEIE